MPLIEPRTLKGFRDYLPETMIPRERLIETARQVYRSFGFLPIDTPALEYTEILLGKGGAETDKQLYRFEDNGGRDVALRFDLTVPLARFVAQYSNDLGLPFKRYHIASVWRGENTQKGRYREFMQCDFDTIGVDGVAADIEMVLVVHELMQKLGFGAKPGEREFKIRLNDRKVLAGILEIYQLQEHTHMVLRALDKFDKIGAHGVELEIVRSLDARDARAHEINSFVHEITNYVGAADSTAALQGLKLLMAGTSTNRPSVVGQEGVARLDAVIEGAKAAGVPPERLVLDSTIARGLDYYTGTILETVLSDLPSIGSVCSGGRYDNLAQLYTKERLPGIGASLGLDRLLAAMEELGMIDKRRSSAPVFLAYFDEAHLNDYLKLAASLRAARIGVEFYPEPKKLDKQIKYAVRRGFRIALIAGDDEWKNGTCQVKDLAAQTARTVKLADLTHELQPYAT